MSFKHYHLLGNTSKGIFWMLVHCLALTMIMVVVRELTTEGLNNYMMIFWQNIFAFIFIVPYTLSKTGFPETKKLHLHIGRAFTGISSGLILFYGLAHVHLNLATAITFTSPLFSTIFAILLLGEKTYRHRIIGLCIGFAGVLVVLRPGTSAFNPYALSLILAPALWGCTDMFIKLMNRTETILTMLFYRAVLMLILTLPFAFFFWQEVSIRQLGLIMLLAGFDITNTATATKAYKYADLNVLMPFDFSRLVFSSIFAFFIFHETLNLWVAIGSGIIVYGTAFVVYKEHKRSRIISTEAT